MAATAPAHVRLHEPIPTLKIAATTSGTAASAAAGAGGRPQQQQLLLTPRSLGAAERALAEQEAIAAEAEEAATCLTARATAAAEAARVPGSGEDAAAEARAANAAATAALAKARVAERAVAKSVGSFLLLSSGGWHYAADKFASEAEARQAAAALWGSWVLFHEQRGALTEVSSGGYGFGHGGIRRYARKGMALGMAATMSGGFYASAIS